jgi:hypothetical protein
MQMPLELSDAEIRRFRDHIVATAPALRESTGSIIMNIDDGRRIERSPRATTGSVRPGVLRVFAAVTAALVTAADSQSLSCDSAEWNTSSGTLKCSTFGGRPNAIELADGGAWTHAYQELAVVPGATYRVSGEFYALAVGECDGAAQVRWCSPSVVLCPGNYTGVSCGSNPLRAVSAALHAEPAVSASGGFAAHMPASWEGRSAGLCR